MPTDKNNQAVTVRVTAVLQIPDVDTDELTAIYKALNEVTAKFGGSYNVNTTPQNTTLPGQ